MSVSVSESNFAICFLLEIPLRGLPFQMGFFVNYRIPKNNTTIRFQRTSFEKEIPSGGSQAGNISQTSCPTVSEDCQHLGRRGAEAGPLLAPMYTHADRQTSRQADRQTQTEQTQTGRQADLRACESSQTQPPVYLRGGVRMWRVR